METHSLRMPASLWGPIEAQAKRENLSTGEYMPQALTRSLLPDAERAVA